MPQDGFHFYKSDAEKNLRITQKKNREDVKKILEKASELKGLSPEEVAVLSYIEDPILTEKLFSTARNVKDRIYGNRLVLFAPLYISNVCKNECLYCAFRASNKGLTRSVLNTQEIEQETLSLIEQGHKRILLVAGEAYPTEGFSYILNAIKTIYKTKAEKGEIRRINVNIAPLSQDQFHELKKAEIGTYQLFQETYLPETYANVHLKGPKTDYQNRLNAIDRAMKAGIDDLGIGVLFGLYDWHFELQAIMQHIRYLEETYGVGPHTISVPRIEPADGSELATSPRFPVSDTDFKKLVAILRLAVPYTGIIMSTRETPEMRRETFSLGVSQISAASRTNPGGYSHDEKEKESSQFSLGDHRSVDEVIKDAAQMGYIPSFCTGCYRLGRTGQDFMDLAKPGAIRLHCYPNALSTFKEYLIDYASKETRKVGEKLIEKTIQEMPEDAAKRSKKMISQVAQGKRDVFC